MAQVASTALELEAPSGSAQEGVAVPSEAGARQLIRDLVSLTKPRLSSLVLFTAGGGLWMSGAEVSWTTGTAAVLGTTMVVGGANALNCYLERDADRLMARTRTRPLPAGRLQPNLALAFGLLLSMVSVPLLTALTTPLAGLLAAVALVLYVLVYTPMKRRSSLSTLVGAIPGALPPLIGWTAATGRLDVGGLLLFSILFLWQIPHSLAIGIYRGPEYAQAGLKVFPNEHGLPATRRQAFLYTIPLIAAPLALIPLGLAGWCTLLVGGGLGLWFLGLAWQGLRQNGEGRWARRFFFASLIYLTGLFAALGLDGLWRAFV